MTASTLYAQKVAPKFNLLNTNAGLPHLTINDMIQDHQGFVWVATERGLARFDGNSFQLWQLPTDESEGLSSKVVMCLHEDAQGRLWSGTEDGQLNYLDAQRNRFEHVHLPEEGQRQARILSLGDDHQGRLWVGRENGLLSILDDEVTHWPELNNLRVTAILADQGTGVWFGTNQGLYLLNTDNQLAAYNPGQKLERVTSLMRSSDGLLWIGSYTQGILVYDTFTRRLKDHFHAEATDTRLTRNQINDLVEDPMGLIWVALYGSGLSVIEPRTKTVHHYDERPSERWGLAGNSLRCLLVDNTGVLWIGHTGLGINTYNSGAWQFGLIVPEDQDSSAPAYGMVWSFYEDPQGQLWMGVDRGLVRVGSDASFNLSMPVPDQPNNKLLNRIRSIYDDGQNGLWIGARDLIYHYNKTNDRFEVRQRSLRRTRQFLKSAGGHLWAVSTVSGLHYYDQARNLFVKTGPDGEHRLPSYSARTITEDPLRADVLWLGASNGLVRYDGQTGDTQTWLFSKDKPDGFPDSAIFATLLGRTGTLWVGTNRHGLIAAHGAGSAVNPSLRFQRFGEEAGILDGEVSSIQMDRDGSLWLGTPKGLCHFDPSTGKGRPYDIYDGILENGFNSGASIHLRDGTMIFGGQQGFNRFKPEALFMEKVPSPLVFTGIYLDDEEQPVPPENYQDRLSMEAQTQVLDLHFSVLDYRRPKGNHYAYILEGLTDRWRPYNTNSHARYTSLPSGNYVFRVKGLNSDNLESEILALDIHVPTPLWKTWWAIVLYVVIAAGLIAARFRRQRARLEREMVLNQRLRKVDSFKDEFLANTSHELRTPLHGMIGLAESLLDGIAGELPEQAQRDLNLIVDSGNRLSNLVNDLLDFSRMKSGEIKLNLTSVDLHSLTNVVLSLARPLAEDRGIYLQNAVPNNLPGVRADENRLQQILHNLVGNGIKFTKEGGVTVKAQIKDDWVEVRVTDTGIGIKPEMQRLIFESFEQADGSITRTHGGTGLGLAVTRKLVILHGGHISVDSRPGAGSTFKFNLKIEGYSRGREIVNAPIQAVLEEPALATLNHDEKGEGPHLLVVDDEPVNRQVLVNHLTHRGYRVSAVSGGQEALHLVMEDDSIALVLLDLMMPVMNGFEVCHLIRGKHRLHELPIIVLSAMSRTIDLKTAFEAGANDYLTKPVGKDELLARVSIHLKLAENVRLLESRNKEIIEAQQQLVMNEKLASVGLLTAGITHEIKNPIQFTSISVQNLEYDLNRFQEYLVSMIDEEAEQEIVSTFKEHFDRLQNHVSLLDEGTRRLATISQDLLNFARRDKPGFSKTDITSSITSTLNLVRSRFKTRVNFQTYFSGPLIVDCKSTELNQVFMNLIVNGCEAIVGMKRSGVTGTLKVTAAREGDFCVVRFVDNGPGMTMDMTQKIFEPFFTAKADGNGTGLGLSISRRIVEDHGGRIEVESEPGKGTTFSLYLPC